MYKLIGVFALVAVVAGNDITVGSVVDGTKIYDQKLEASPAIWRQDKNYTVNATEGDVISRVLITDLRPLKDGEAQIVEGGEGHQNVTIELKSPAVFRGFEFNVQVYVVPDQTQKGVVTDLPKSEETPKGQENDPQVPISVGVDNLDDNLRKTRKTQEQEKDNGTPKLFVNNEASTTPSSTPVQQSTQVSSNPTPASSNPTPVSSYPTPVPSNPTLVLSGATPVVIKENDGQKFNIPIDIGKDIKTEVSTTQKPKQQVENNGESDIIDPTLVGHQPTHLNNTENAKGTDKTTEKSAIHPQEVSNEGLTKDTKRNVRHTEDITTESYVTTLRSTTGQESTTQVKDSSSTEEDEESTEIHSIPNYNLGVKSPWADTIKPIGTNKDFAPPKTIGADNVAVKSNPAMVPLPYNH